MKVIDNAYKQYIRSRPTAASESIKRAKQLDLANIGITTSSLFNVACWSLSAHAMSFCWCLCLRCSPCSPCSLLQMVFVLAVFIVFSAANCYSESFEGGFSS